MVSPALSRSRFKSSLVTGGSAAGGCESGGAGLAATLSPASANSYVSRQRRAGGALGATYRTRLALLGTAAGRTVYGGSERQGIASAVVVEDATYLVDLGDGHCGAHAARRRTTKKKG